jgi:hypothetical protein
MARPNPVDPLNFTTQADRELVVQMNDTNKDLAKVEKENSKTKKDTRAGKLKQEDAELREAKLYRENARAASALSGDMFLELAVDSEDVSASALNAAAATTFKRTVTLKLKTSKGDAHTWACFAPVWATGETVADADVSAPTVVGVPKLNRGAVLATVVFDTGAGKTYVPGETLTVTGKVSSDDKKLGYTVASVTKTFVVV